MLQRFGVWPVFFGGELLRREVHAERPAQDLAPQLDERGAVGIAVRGPAQFGRKHREWFSIPRACGATAPGGAYVR